MCILNDLCGIPFNSAIFLELNVDFCAAGAIFAAKVIKMMQTDHLMPVFIAICLGFALHSRFCTRRDRDKNGVIELQFIELRKLLTQFNSIQSPALTQFNSIQIRPEFIPIQFNSIQ